MIIGLDPSLSCTAAVANLPADRPVEQCFASGPGSLVATVPVRMGRAWRQAEDVAIWCAAKKPQLIVIEGYAYGSQTQGHHDHVEYGGLLRHALVQRCEGARFVEVAPAALKIWACGNGAARKPFIADAIEGVYGLKFTNFDLMDAWCLMQIGLQLVGLADPRGARQEFAIEKIKGRGQKKPKRKHRSIKQAMRAPKQKGLFS